MKIMKRIATMLLAVCLTVPCFSMIALAAEGIIFFDDIETKVGDTFEIEGTVVAKNDVLGEATVELSYDTDYIRFVEGEGVEASGDGKLTFTGSGNGSDDRVKFVMKFQALQEGSTRVDQDQVAVTTESGESVTCEEGYSDIKIGEGDPSKIQQTGKSSVVTIAGEEYELSEEFSESNLPAGFEMGELTYEGDTYKCAVQKANNLYAAYLIDRDGKADFWFYNEKDAKFYAFEEIVISDMYSIMILDGTNEVKMPSEYTESSMEINGKEFPVWVDTNRDGFYVMYAMNSDGEKSLYLYDSMEHTYQRMETPEVAAKSPAKKATGLMDKIEAFIVANLVWFLVAVGCFLIILLAFLIVMAVKLRHRNLELDDLYDEYGIDEGKNDNLKAQPKKNEFKKPVSEETAELNDFYDNDFDDADFDDDEYYDEEDAYDDEYEDGDYEDEEDPLAELRKDYGESSAKNVNFDAYYDDDDFEEDYEEEYDESSAGSVSDDTFEMDFIDLD